MRVETLRVTNLRALEAAEFQFRPGFNLLVGVNGVGKTTVLDALAYCLSGVTKQQNALRTSAREPVGGDIRFGAASMTIECGLKIGGETFTYLLHEPLAEAAVARTGAGKPREETHELLPRREFVGPTPSKADAKDPNGRPLAVLFSTRRASAVKSEAKQKRAAGGTAAAFSEALEDRELVLSAFADWMRAQKELSTERPESGRVLEAFEAATRRFLPGYFNLRVEHDPIAAAVASQAAANAAAAAADPDAMKAARRAADFAAEAMAAASQAWALVIDYGKRTTVRVDSTALTDTERAQLKQAISWAEDWLALHWTGEELGKNHSPEKLAQARSEAREKKIAEGMSRFVPTCRDLRADEDGKQDAIVDRLPTTLSVRQLSDGERGTLAMVLDLTRRLAQANPHMDDPAAQAEAVVLIDEIDLHLHPRWQREVIHNLTAAFPKCQFIATTHSPQVISEVPHDRVQIMTPEGVYSPEYSYGIDSSRILEEIMDVHARPKEIEELLKRVSSLVGEEKLSDARKALSELSSRLELGDNDPEVTRLRTLLGFVEGEE